MHENLGQPSQQNFSNSPPLPFPSCLSTSYPVDSIHPPGINTSTTPPYFPATLHLWQLSTHIKCPNFATCNMCGELNLVNRKVKPKRRVLRSKDRLVRTSSWWKDHKDEQQKQFWGLAVWVACCDKLCRHHYAASRPKQAATRGIFCVRAVPHWTWVHSECWFPNLIVTPLLLGNFAVVSKKNSSGQASCKCVIDYYLASITQGSTIKKWYFLGIIPELVGPTTPPVPLGIEMLLLAKKDGFQGYQNFT